MMDHSDLSTFTHVLLMNYSYRHDFSSLRFALEKYDGVLGMMGSARKRNKLFADLPAELHKPVGRVRCPVGIDLSATSSAEIAVAVLAQVIGASTHSDSTSTRCVVRPERTP